MYKISVQYFDESSTVLEVAGLAEAHAWVEERFPPPYVHTWQLNQVMPGVSADRVTVNGRAVAIVELSPVIDLITSGEAAKLLGCDRRTVMRLADRGDIPVHEYVGPRRERLFNADAIRKLAESGELPTLPSWGRPRPAAKA